MLDVTRLRVIDAVARHGSVTAAAKELHYSQPSVSHHLARLEAETGAQLLQRVGRGVRLTQAGQLLAERAAEILGRIDAAVGRAVGPRRAERRPGPAGRVLLRARHARARGRATLAERHPGCSSAWSTATRPRRCECCAPVRSTSRSSSGTTRASRSERASGCCTCSTTRPTCCRPAEPSTRSPGTAMRTWIAGCERCRSHLLAVCAAEGFAPRIGYTTDDIVAMQALVAAGLGVTIMPGLALRAHRRTAWWRPSGGVAATRLRGDVRRTARPAGHRRRAVGACRVRGIAGLVGVTPHG